MMHSLSAGPVAPRARAPAPRARLAVPVRAAISSDATARVRGDAQQVSWYASDVSLWPEWSPAARHAVKLGAAPEPVQRGTRFELRQELAWGALAFPMRYEVIDLEPGRRLVLSGLSEHHTEATQLLFMPDRTDPRMTIVRYVFEARLREWRSALQPVASRLLARLPEEAMSGLAGLLNGARSPLLTTEFQEAWRLHAGAAAGVRKGRGSGAAASAAVAGATVAAASAAARRQEQRREWQEEGQERRRRAAAQPAVFWAPQAGWRLGGLPGSVAAASQEHFLDPAGHYAALGLVPAPGAAPPTTEDVRAAYRRLALQLHPDRQTGKPAHAQKQAAVRFARTLRAYEALKDPEARRLYNAGLVIEPSAAL